MPTSTGGIGRFARKKQQEDIGGLEVCSDSDSEDMSRPEAGGSGDATTTNNNADEVENLLFFSLTPTEGEGSVNRQPKTSKGLAEGRESIKAATQRLAAARKWTKAAAGAVELAQSQLRMAQDEEKEAGSFLESVEKRYEVIDVDLDDAPANPAKKRQRTVSLSPRQDGSDESAPRLASSSSTSQNQSTTTSQAMPTTSISNSSSTSMPPPTRPPPSSQPNTNPSSTAQTRTTSTAQTRTTVQRQQRNDSSAARNQISSTSTNDSALERAQADVSNLASKWRERENTARAVTAGAPRPPREMTRVQHGLGYSGSQPHLPPPPFHHPHQMMFPMHPPNHPFQRSRYYPPPSGKWRW